MEHSHNYRVSNMTFISSPHAAETVKPMYRGGDRGSESGSDLLWATKLLKLQLELSPRFGCSLFSRSGAQ